MVTGFGYNRGDPWETNMHLFKHFTDITQGVRRLGATSVDLCHTACGKVDGKPFLIYDNQILASNANLHPKIVNEIETSTLEFNS